MTASLSDLSARCVADNVHVYGNLRRIPDHYANVIADMLIGKSDGVIGSALLRVLSASEFPLSKIVIKISSLLPGSLTRFIETLVDLHIVLDKPLNIKLKNAICKLHNLEELAFSIGSTSIDIKDIHKLPKLRLLHLIGHTEAWDVLNAPLLDNDVMMQIAQSISLREFIVKSVRIEELSVEFCRETRISSFKIFSGMVIGNCADGLRLWNERLRILEMDHVPHFDTEALLELTLLEHIRIVTSGYQFVHEWLLTMISSHIQFPSLQTYSLKGSIRHSEINCDFTKLFPKAKEIL